MDNDTIRPADEVRVQQLREDNRSEYDKQIDEAIQISLREMQEQQRVYMQYEKQLLEDYNKETVRRANLFKDFMFNLRRTSGLDKNIMEVLTILEPIVEGYCNQTRESFELDSNTYDLIFNNIKRIRNNQDVLDILRIIIMKE